MSSLKLRGNVHLLARTANKSGDDCFAVHRTFGGLGAAVDERQIYCLVVKLSPSLVGIHATDESTASAARDMAPYRSSYSQFTPPVRRNPSRRSSCVASGGKNWPSTRHNIGHYGDTVPSHISWLVLTNMAP